MYTCLLSLACLSKCTILFAYLFYYCSGIPIDNGVEGEPEIECASKSISIKFITRNPFEGHVFVKGHYFDPECRNNEVGSRGSGIELPFSNCGLRRNRSLNPRGILVSTTVVISFHKKFITKVDRAYRINCFYMEADKTVSAGLEVSMLTTDTADMTVAMPVCTYQVLQGGPRGPEITFASIGDKVYHKWSCDAEHKDMFCMRVHSCYVDDGKGDRSDLVDPNGCQIDPVLLQQLEYISDLEAGRETHVYKFADRPVLYFQCQISIEIKRLNEACPRPVCSRITSTTFAYRGKRHVGGDQVTDVTAQPITIADISALHDVHNATNNEYNTQFKPPTICVPTIIFVTVCTGTTLTIASLLCFFIGYRRIKSKLFN